MTARKLAACIVGGVFLSCGGRNPSSSQPVATVAGPGLKKDDSTATLGIVLVGNVPPKVAAMTGSIWQLAMQARQLKAKEPVKLQVLTGPNIVAVVKKHVATEIPPELIRGEGACFSVLGLVPANYDYEQETYLLLEEELAGLYMPDDKTMYASSTLDDDELEQTLSHELVHALQDQYFQIGKRMKYAPGQTEALGALHALAEGDATSAMLDEMLIAEGIDVTNKNAATMVPDRDPEDFLTLSNGAKKKGTRLAGAPRFISLDLLAPYADGLRFVNALRRRGGWRAVDQAWANPPLTTEQLLHIEKYDAHETAIDVPVATAKALGAGWKKTFDDVFGEGEMRLAFGEWMDTASSKTAAGGWGGDHVALFEADGGKRAVAWHIVYDTEQDALESMDFLSIGWATAYGAPTKSSPAKDKLAIFGLSGSKSTTAMTKPGALPPLPDATLKSVAPNAATGCRAIRLRGKGISLIAGAPCASIALWSDEVAGITP